MWPVAWTRRGSKKLNTHGGDPVFVPAHVASPNLCGFFHGVARLMKEITFHIRGIAPLLMHSGQLANPLNPLVKEMKVLTGQRKKTDDTHLELSRLEFRAGLYLNAAGQVVIPSEVLESCIIEGAKKAKLGKAFKSAIAVQDDAVLDYGKQLTPEEMWSKPEAFVDVRGVKVGTSRVMRTRPIFRTWQLMFEVIFDGDQINAENVVQAVSDAGRQVGLCDYRPKFGRFEIVE